MSYKVLIAGAVVVLSFALFTTGTVLLALYGMPYRCPNLPVLRPGGQGSCNKTASDLFYTAEVTTENGTSSLVTYVFNEQPQRIFVEEKFDHTLSKEDYVRIDIPMIPGAVYKWKINVDIKMDIYFRTPKHGKTSGTIYYKKTDVKQGEGSYTAEKAESNTYFEVSAWKKGTGSFSLTAILPQWDVTSKKPVDSCTGYPCEWKFSDNAWGTDSDLWIVTVNNGTSDYEVEMTLRNNGAVWITIPVIMMVIGFIGFFGGIVAVVILFKS